ncbi:ets DNA-binding protein pokkuri-like isoform X2 [Tachypleus tridentatus]
MMHTTLLPETLACPCHGVSAFTVPSFLDPWDRLKLVDSWPHGDQVTAEPTSTAATELLLPKDPRHWTREHVALWLQHMTSRHRLPAVQLDRFLMNGKALCLMNIEMFVRRVPLGGKLLYKDFQLRLSSALYC